MKGYAGGVEGLGLTLLCFPVTACFSGLTLTFHKAENPTELALSACSIQKWHARARTIRKSAFCRVTKGHT